jgi:hypothetical protein
MELIKRQRVLVMAEFTLDCLIALVDVVELRQWQNFGTKGAGNLSKFLSGVWFLLLLFIP